MRNHDTVMMIAGVLVLALLVCFISVVWRAASSDAAKLPPKTCTRVYDRRDGAGSIIITWDDPRVCRRV